MEGCGVWLEWTDWILMMIRIPYVRVRVRVRVWVSVIAGLAEVCLPWVLRVLMVWKSVTESDAYIEFLCITIIYFIIHVLWRTWIRIILPKFIILWKMFHICHVLLQIRTPRLEGRVYGIVHITLWRKFKMDAVLLVGITFDNGENYAFEAVYIFCVNLCVCVLICVHENSKSCGLILVKFSVR